MSCRRPAQRKLGVLHPTLSTDTIRLRIAPCPSVGLRWTMKLWDSLTTCLVLLSAVRPSSLLRSRQRPASAERGGEAAGSPLEAPPVQSRLLLTSPDETPAAGNLDQGERDTMEELIQGDKKAMDFIKTVIRRVRRSSSAETSSASTTFSSRLSGNWSRTRHRRERKKGAKLRRGKEKGRENNGEEMSRRSGRGGGGGGRGQGCMLRQIHLNVTDLGLGYSSREEMIFRYCSGPCRKSETNYDKILSNLVNKRRLPAKDMPLQACCRPIAFDDDLSFLDDNLIYHTVKKHSARKCGCV